jgi:mitochondrial import receptor subunit TOM40
MATSTPIEMHDLVDPYVPKSTPTPFSSKNPLVNVAARFSQWREDLGLPFPGSIENLQREAKCQCSFILLAKLMTEVD